MLTYEQAKAKWEVIQKLEPKRKYAELKQLCYQGTLSNDPSLAEIDFFSSLIMRCLKTIGFPGALKKKLNSLKSK